jgi:hypothetical protein
MMHNRSTSNDIWPKTAVECPSWLRPRARNRHRGGEKRTNSRFLAVAERWRKRRQMTAAAQQRGICRESRVRGQTPHPHFQKKVSLTHGDVRTNQVSGKLGRGQLQIAVVACHPETRSEKCIFSNNQPVGQMGSDLLMLFDTAVNVAANVLSSCSPG